MTSSPHNKLAVVCTPIGNLSDLSPRASSVLKEASLVLCEDTRHSKPLLDRVGSHARLVSCHAHNERDRKELVVVALKSGEKVALITDAGAPGLSDPGGRIVEEVIAAGCEIEVVPGPTALTGALMGAGIDVNRFAFFGFLPKRGGGRTELLEGAARAGLGVVVYEAPQRTDETLADMFAVLGARRVVVARELTKLHETFHRGVLAEDGGARLLPPFVDKGEVVIVVEAGAPKADALAGEDVEAIARDETLPPKERAKRIAKVLGIPVREAYTRVQKAGDDVDGRIERVRDHLAAAAKALLDADDLARIERGLARMEAPRHEAESDIPGAEALMSLLARPPSFRAPVEGSESAKAILAALSAVDALLDALEFERERERNPHG